ncbi:hypothetical protein [Nocardioides convexus]|uniref:hypothetical protein n=1 Tax=Nocardioides convexus TaxID=2712224 RepID=UPI00241825F1|nr:hypothetical protein [Nocardioides convexus]
MLSLRMGELLGTVDDIAEDIQIELARASQVDAGFAPEEANLRQQEEKRPASVSPEIIRAETRRIVDELHKPTSLATIAARLRSTFGQDNVTGWLGHPSFKAFLVDAVPGIRIVHVGPSLRRPGCYRTG